MDEVEHYMSVHLQQREAKRDLQVISQRHGENISEYYHRIRSLRQKAKAPEDDRVDQFLTTTIYVTQPLYIVTVKVLHPSSGSPRRS
jgi:hypothetical protein